MIIPSLVGLAVFTRASIASRGYATAFPSVCLYVCLCVTRVLCVKTAKLLVKILLPPDSSIILVFRHRGSLLNSDSFTLNGGAEYKGEKIGRFLTNKSVYLGNGHSCYTSRIGNHTQAIEWWHF